MTDDQPIKAEDLAVAVGAIVRADAVVDGALLDRAPRLRVLRTGVGVDLVDLAAASGRGIPVVITPGSGAVADGVLALALHLSVERRGRPLSIRLTGSQAGDNPSCCHCWTTSRFRPAGGAGQPGDDRSD